MRNKKLVSAIAVLALMVVTFGLFHSRPEIKPVTAAEHRPVQNLNHVSAQGPIAAEEPSALLGKSFPVEPRRGKSAQSTDFLTALMHHQDLVLSKADIEKMLTAYLQVCAKQSEYEASIAKVIPLSPTENSISIPSYQSEGAKLQAELVQQFEKILGAGQMEQIKTELLPELYARNFGFGEAEQEIDVKLVEGEPITYEFSHSVGTLHVQMSNGVGTVTYKNMSATVPIGDLGRYAGMINLLPKGGS